MHNEDGVGVRRQYGLRYRMHGIRYNRTRVLYRWFVDPRSYRRTGTRGANSKYVVTFFIRFFTSRTPLFSIFPTSPSHGTRCFFSFTPQTKTRPFARGHRATCCTCNRLTRVIEINNSGLCRFRVATLTMENAEIAISV